MTASAQPGLPALGAGRAGSQAVAAPACTFTAFTLENGTHLRETQTHDANPLCRLAARTAAGQFVCGQGCGMKNPAMQAVHACPFGLHMLKVAGEKSRGQRTHWIGRRFTSAYAMHKTLEKLAESGLDEETILDHLPVNPIVTPDEMALGAVDAASRRDPANETGSDAFYDTEDAEARAAESIANRMAGGVGERLANGMARPLDEAEALRAWNVFEYLEQIQALLQSANTPGKACSRFLHGMACLVKFREMSIYLESEGSDHSDGPVLEALIDNTGKETGGAAQKEGGQQPRARNCRLGASHLGVRAMREQRIMVEAGGEIVPFAGDWEGFTSMAIPFPEERERAVGVWLIEGVGAKPSRLGPEPVRVMRLQADMLALRVDQMRQAMAGEKARQALSLAARTDYLCFLDGINMEISRAQRSAAALVVLCFKVKGGDASGPLPIAELSRGLRQMLRPYDHMLTAYESSPCWFVALPMVGPEGFDERIARRLIEHFQNVLDAAGGMEERGARLGAGLSQWGADAANVAELMEHSRVAAENALGGDDNASLVVYHVAARDGAGLVARTGSN